MPFSVTHRLAAALGFEIGPDPTAEVWVNVCPRTANMRTRTLSVGYFHNVWDPDETAADTDTDGDAA